MHNCPPEKLLIYNVKDGWPSLCAFMEIDHMQGPLPHENKSKDAKDTHEFLDATMEQFMTICKREVLKLFDFENLSDGFFRYTFSSQFQWHYWL